MPDANPTQRAAGIFLLTLVAGSADALGYLNLGKVFTSNMTGNLVLMGISLSEGRGGDTWRSLFAFAAFIVGNCLGAIVISAVSTKDPPRAGITAAVGCEAGLLLGFAIAAHLLTDTASNLDIYGLIALLALAMGVQSSVVYRLGTPGVTTTAITGTLTTLFAGLIRLVQPQSQMAPEHRGVRTSFALQATVVALYFGGAAVGGVLNLQARSWAEFFPVAVVSAVLVVRLLRSE